MSTHKHIDRICLAAMLAALLLAVLFMNGEALGIAVVTDGDSGDGPFTQNDLDGDWDTSGATEILLDGEDSKIRGSGAYLENGNIHIACAGKYILSGALTNGSIMIDAGSGDKIWLLLNGVSLRCEDGAALRVEQAKKVFLTLADDTHNTIASGADYSAASVEAGVDGAVYSRDDLTINGGGALTVTGEYRHGIVCNDNLVITGGTLVITAVEDGIHANDSVKLANADITITAGDDGVTVSNDDGTDFIYMASGTLSIPSCYEGLESTLITMDGGTVCLTPTDDGINARGTGGNCAIRIHGGEITIINPDGRDADGLDSNGDIEITGGKVFISVSSEGGNCAIDYGSENAGVCKISGGTVIACGGSAMAEGFDSSSEQAFLMYTASGSAGTAVSLADADGAMLLSEIIPCSFSSVILSSPELQLGNTYTITAGDVQEQVVADNSSASGGFGNFGGFGMPGGGMNHGRGGRSDLPVSGDGNTGRPSTWENPPQGVPVPPDGTENAGAPGERMPDGAENAAPFQPGQTDDRADGFPPQNGRGDMGYGMGWNPEQDTGNRTDETIPAATIVLLGVSVLFLLLGLLFAAKIKH